MANDPASKIAALSRKSPPPAPKAGVGLESVQRPRDNPKRVGNNGSETLEASRSARAYVVSQKRPDPLPRRGALVGALGLETVIGADERKRILDTDLLPWRMICALEMYGADDSTMIGTGWLVGPSTIITAGHCVYLNEFGPQKWAKRIKIMPGRNGGEHPFKDQECESLAYSVHARWAEAVDVNGSGQDYDIGAIHLDKPIGNALGWFGIEVLSESELVNYLVNISGYPADRGQGTEQYFHANRVKNVTSRRVFYDIDTFGGQSGSPVWIHRDPQAPPTVIGIHAYGIGGSTLQLNSAPRIDAEILQLIEHWISEDNKRLPSGTAIS